MSPEKTVWTIGHSTRTLEEFIHLLLQNKIEMLVDIRSFPGSRKFPQFNKENLSLSIPQQGIAYLHLVQLGGRRKVLKDSHNTAWRHPAFRGYADYMETPEFEHAIHELEALASQKHLAYMCSEAVWWRCHRSMVSDWLKLHGWKVLHILDENHLQEHPYTQPARLENGNLVYTPGKSGQLRLDL